MSRLHWKQNRFLHITLWLMLAVGVGMMLLPRIDEWIQERKQNQLLTEWTKELRSSEEQSTKLESSASVNGSPHAAWKEIDGVPVLGTIAIDKIALREAIVKGADPESLDLGIGVVEADRFSGQNDHLVLAGHRSFKPGKHFNRLGELERGDRILIETAEGTVAYAVKTSFLVEPTDLSVLNSHSEEAELTLITCHPMRNPTHRLIVKASQVF
ncbi:class D sortase [Tumebacillus algifaecis]|nr:class D sortase [Tumebacillus algifaecis]